MVLEFTKTDVPFIAGHDLLTTTIDIHIPHQKPFRDFKSVNVTMLNDYLRYCDWSVITGGTRFSLNAGLECLYGNLNTALDTLAPIKTFSYKKRRHPWFTTYHRSLITERDRLYKR